DLGLADRFFDSAPQAVLDSLVEGRYQDDADANRTLLYRHLRELAVQPEGLDAQVSRRRDTIERLCDGATVNEVVARILDHPQGDAWIDRARQTLAAGCPQTMHLVWEQLHRARHLSLAEVLRMEWCLAVQCCLHPDFREGVRALLID